MERPGSLREAGSSGLAEEVWLFWGLFWNKGKEAQTILLAQIMAPEPCIQLLGQCLPGRGLKWLSRFLFQ